MQKLGNLFVRYVTFMIRKKTDKKVEKCVCYDLEGKDHGAYRMCRFEYVFDLSFCALAWRAAEEFEKESDSSGEEGPSTVSKVPAPASQEASVDENTELHKKAKEDVVSNEGVRRVQVTGEAHA